MMRQACQVGIWIDDRQAILVWLSEGSESVECLVSGLFADPYAQERAPESRPAEHAAAAAAAAAARQARQRARYYHEVIDRLRGANGIYLIGPGRAKDELYRELVRAGMAGVLAAVETAEHLTLAAIAVRLRKLFQPQQRPVRPEWREAVTETPYPAPYPEEEPEDDLWAPLS